MALHPAWTAACFPTGGPETKPETPRLRIAYFEVYIRYHVCDGTPVITVATFTSCQNKAFDTVYMCFAAADGPLLLPSLERFNRLGIAKLSWRPERGNDEKETTKRLIRESSIFQLCWSIPAKVMFGQPAYRRLCCVVDEVCLLLSKAGDITYI